MGLLFICCLLSIPLGMGLAKLLMATLLEKSNIVGNSLTDTEEISSPITLIERSDEEPLLDWESQLTYALEEMKSTPEYQDSIKNKLDVDIDYCAQGITMRNGFAVMTGQIISPIKDIKIEPVADPARDQAGSVPPPPAAPKRSWKEAVDDSFMDMDERDS